jgi:hypothetical protein
MYLDRIAAYDKKGPALNAMIIISPNVLSAADALDAKFARSGFAPLHCVPVCPCSFWRAARSRGAGLGEVEHGGVRPRRTSRAAVYSGTVLNSAVTGFSA